LPLTLRRTGFAVVKGTKTHYLELACEKMKH
jgi:hypothetical protein